MRRRHLFTCLKAKLANVCRRLLPRLWLKQNLGVLCGHELESELAELVEKQQLQLSCWGDSREQLAADLFYLLRDFDRTCPDVILAERGGGRPGTGNHEPPA